MLGFPPLPSPFAAQRYAFSFHAPRSNVKVSLVFEMPILESHFIAKALYVLLPAHALLAKISQFSVVIVQEAKLRI
jgi:hypothetical protein